MTMRTAFNLLALALIIGTALGQSQKPADVEETRFYTATAELTLNNASGAVTLQLPAKSSARAYLQSAVLKCSAACTVSQERDGTAVTTNVVTSKGLNTGATAAAALYGPSGSSGGTAILQPLPLDANEPLPLDMTYSMFGRNAAAAQNHTFRVATMTGTFTVSVIWGER
jgi:hypothetical protein